MVNDASRHLSFIPQRMRVSGNVTKVRRLKDNGVTNLTFWGHVTSSVTWPFDSRVSTSYGSSIVTMRLSCTVTEIWSFKVLPGRFFQEQWSVDGRSVGPQYYTDLIYSSSLR